MLAVRISLDAGIADPEALMIAVAFGDVKTVNSALEKHPEMVTKQYMWHEGWIFRNVEPACSGDYIE